MPHSNSIGEKYRIRQLLHQLPPYDCEARYCNELSEAERHELLMFCAQRKQDAVGQGVVKPMPDISIPCAKVGLLQKVDLAPRAAERDLSWCETVLFGVFCYSICVFVNLWHLSCYCLCFLLQTHFFSLLRFFMLLSWESILLSMICTALRVSLLGGHCMW